LFKGDEEDYVPRAQSEPRGNKSFVESRGALTAHRLEKECVTQSMGRNDAYIMNISSVATFRVFNNSMKSKYNISDIQNKIKISIKSCQSAMIEIRWRRYFSTSSSAK